MKKKKKAFSLPAQKPLGELWRFITFLPVKYGKAAENLDVLTKV